MTLVDIEAVRDSDFSADAKIEGSLLTATVSGNADLNARLSLDRFVASVHEEVRRRSLKEVLVDFRQLAFMNSSCLKSLIRWVAQIQDSPTDEHYRIVFLSSPALHWQKRSLHAIACLASDIVTIEMAS
jgi:hypothetical protein